MENLGMKFWEDKRVFVTGSTGLVGGWLVKRLCEMKADVVVLVRDWVPKSKLISLSCMNNKFFKVL